MSALHLNDAGTWRQIRKVYVNDAGVWRTITRIYVNDSGTWRVTYTAITLTDVTNHRDGSGSGITSQVNITNTGVVSGNANDPAWASYNWLPAGLTASDYEVMATLTSGSLATGTTGSWLNLGTSRSWTVTHGIAVGSNTAVLTMQIRDAATLSVLATATFTIIAESFGP